MIVPPGFLNCQLIFTVASGRQALTACGFEALAVAPDAAEDVVTAYNGTNWQGLYCTEDTVLTLVRLVIGTSDPSAPILQEFGTALPGGNSDEGTQPNTALLVTKSTLLGGRKGRGRSFLPGLSDAAIDPSGDLNAGGAGVRSAAEELWPAVGAALGSADPYLFHSDVEDEPSLITAFTASVQVATQRRRFRG